ISQPAMRDMFMRSSNVLRAREAVLSVLAGDIFRKTPIWPSLAVFKGIYYLSSLRHARRSWAAWKQRKEDIRV
ncbi:hydroxylase, partial [Acidithiobacillus ferridurans]|nr:hydroxylase [Acidithiobacillus ferridurans]